MKKVSQEYVEFLFWLKERTELYWAQGAPKSDDDDFPEWALGARWIGMSEDDILKAEQKHNLLFTPEHREFLKILHTPDKKQSISGVSFFYNWMEEGGVLEKDLNFPFSTLLKYVMREGPHVLWLKKWGPMPSDPDIRKEIFTEIYSRQPKPIPVFSHRSQIADLSLEEQPILSIMGLDIVVYGWDFQTYLLSELSSYMNWPKRKSEYRKYLYSDRRKHHKDRIPFWGDLL